MVSDIEILGYASRPRNLLGIVTLEITLTFGHAMVQNLVMQGVKSHLLDSFCLNFLIQL